MAELPKVDLEKVTKYIAAQIRKKQNAEAQATAQFRSQNPQQKPGDPGNMTTKSAFGPYS